MIFIANYWMDPAETTVIVYSNCEHVELRLNGRLISSGGRQKDSDSTHLLRPPFVFNIDRFEVGRLEATGLNKGRAVVQTVRSTPGQKHHHLKLQVDESNRSLTNNDAVFIYAYVMDENDTVIPDATDSIRFSISGSTAKQEVSFIGNNPVRAEAGIATILLKTQATLSVRHVNVIATSSTLERRDSQLVIEIERKK